MCFVKGEGVLLKKMLKFCSPAARRRETNAVNALFLVSTL